MGATTFQVFIPKESFGRKAKTAQEAFAIAKSDARAEYGNRPYTGTIAEKNSFIMIDEKPRSLADSVKYSDRLIETEDARVRDKHGPAGCLVVRTAGNKAQHGFLFFGWADY